MLWRVFVPQLPGETHILLGALSSVLTVTPEHLRPTGLGGAWEDKAAFGCPRPGGQSASARWPAGETGSQPCHPLFLLPRTSRFCRDITGQMLLVISAADVSLAPGPCCPAHGRCPGPFHHRALLPALTVSLSLIQQPGGASRNTVQPQQSLVLNRSVNIFKTST